MSMNGYNETFIDKLDEEVISITRHNPNTHQSILLVTRTAFHESNDECKIKEYKVALKFDKILLEAKLVRKEIDYKFEANKFFINGLENYELKMQENLSEVDKSYFISSIINDKNNETIINFKELPQGAVIVFSFKLDETKNSLVENLRSTINELKIYPESNIINEIIDELTLNDLNILLFRCAEEEMDEQQDSCEFIIPDYGPPKFFGLQDFVNILRQLHMTNDLAHPLIDNLRRGDWIMNFIISRLKLHLNNSNDNVALRKLTEWLECVFNNLRHLPRTYVPVYFDALILSLYNALVKKCYKLLSQTSGSVNFLQNGSSFIHNLALATIQFVSYCKTAKLPNVIPNAYNQNFLSIAAGIPQYSFSAVRNWGRDTFGSLKGLLLLFNRHQDAKYLILCYAACLKYGLIPNLLNEGMNPRYDSRDAVWWWLKAIKEYTEYVPNGYEILNEEVYRLYPNDDSKYPVENSPKQKLCDLIQEALSVHVNGLEFIETSSDSSLDENINKEDFKTTIGVDLTTGFVYGGNDYNCGTWMNKMISSMTGTNTFDTPATPRDGSAVELVGLCRCVLKWLIEMNNNGYYLADGVKLNEKIAYEKNFSFLSWKEWAAKIDENFEKYFWIDHDLNESEHVNKHEIYKDSVGSNLVWADYQLRPNYLVALAVAPEMVNKEHAIKALEQCDKYLFNNENSLGIKTLDPQDSRYSGIYDPSNDTENACSCHNGTEWLWLVSYYMKCLIQYSNSDDHDKVIRQIQCYLANLCNHIKLSEWNSLPQFTNENGVECIFACPSQAWSIASAIEIFNELIKF